MVRVVLAVCAGLALGKAAQAQDQEVLNRIIAGWSNCVSGSYRIQNIQIPDPSLAVEQAFMACQTEENAIWSMLQLPAAQIYQYRTLYRLKMKRQLAGQ